MLSSVRTRSEGVSVSILSACQTKVFRHLATIFIFLSIFSCSPSSVTGEPRQRVFCKYVLDGDTIILTDGRRVRYLEINAPEIAHKDQPGEPFGREAAEFNRRLVQGKALDILPSRVWSHDRFGRLLAHVFLTDGRLVSQILVRKGLAYCCFFEKPDRFARRLLSAQKSAITLKRGMWDMPVTSPEPYYIGNKKSLRFHRPWCVFAKKISPGNQIIFKSKKQAFLKGYCPCKRCLP